MDAAVGGAFVHRRAFLVDNNPVEHARCVMDFGMIEVITQLTPEALAPVQAYLTAAPPAPPVQSPEIGEAVGEHDPRWLAVLAQAMGHRPYLLIARDSAEGPVQGLLPLAHVRSRLFGSYLVSLPYLNRGGVVAQSSAIASALIDRAIELAAELDVAYLELRHSSPIAHPGLPAQRDEKHRMVLTLPATPEALWKGLDAKVRNQVRKGDKAGLSIQWGSHALLDPFYDVFAVNMRDLGTPVYGKDLFRSIMTHFPQQAELAVVSCAGRPVAGAILLHEMGSAGSPGVTQVPSASSLREFNHTSANMWMYHQLLLRAIERRAGVFDFGRSSEGSGTYKFKKQWGAQPEPTVWQYHVRRGDINAVRPDSPKYRRRIEMWQRLPVWLTRMVGPTLVRGIP